MELSVQNSAGLRDITFSVAGHTLKLRYSVRGVPHTLYFHDNIRRGGKTYCLYHAKTAGRVDGSCVTLRTTAVEPDSAEPLRGLLVTLRFTFDPVLSAMHASVSYGTDAPLTDCRISCLDLTWDGMDFTDFAGFETDAFDAPYTSTFPLPPENPDALTYDELQIVTPHTAWEKQKTRPKTFREGVAVYGKRDYLAVFGGKPTFEIDSRFLSPVSDLSLYNGDIRYYSGSSAPGVWFLLDRPEDFFAAKAELDARTPSFPSAAMTASQPQTVTLDAGSLSATLLRSDGGILLQPLGAPDAQPIPLFTVTLWDTVRQRKSLYDSAAGWDRVDILERGQFTRIILSDPDCGRAAGISVFLEAVTDRPHGRISWKMKVIDRSDTLSVLAATYPQCAAAGYRTVINNEGSGVLVKDFARHNCVYSASYPCGSHTVFPFTAMYNAVPPDSRCPNGLYCGVHDPNGNEKNILIAGAGQSGQTLFSVTCPATFVRRPGNSQTLPGQMVWQAFSGDWYDAALIYRDFVENSAVFYPKLRGCPQIPRWLRETPVWAMEFLPNDNPDAAPIPVTLRNAAEAESEKSWYEDTVALRKALGVPLAFHAYNWHWVPFNFDNPHYFPAHHGFKEGVRALREAGVRVVPYIAGFSWDMNDDRGADDRFLSDALPAACKDETGKVISKSYAATKPNGELTKFARMCPSTTVWKNELRQIVRKLYTDYEADGVYLDVISAGYAHCCDETHNHAPGHGDFFWKAYAELLESLRADAPHDFALISESVSEVYTAELDACLTWTWVQPDPVPIFPAIYSGYFTTFGRVITGNKRYDNAYFRFHTAQSLLYGQQIGWLHPDIVRDEAQFPYLKKIVTIRWALREFFPAARMLRPPYTEGCVPALDTDSYLRSRLLTHEKAVLAAGWEGEDGTRRLFLFNTSDREADCTFTVRQSEYQLPAALTEAEFSESFTLTKTARDGELVRITCHFGAEGYAVCAWQ